MPTNKRALPDPATEPTISIERAASILGIGLRSAYTAAERDEIPHVKVGRSIRVLSAKFLKAYGLVEE